jgi:hypothetical protein
VRNVITVTQRCDGRGGAYPTWNSANLVKLDDEYCLVTTDGRFNIPRRVFEKYSVKAKNGRKFIAIAFTAVRNGVVYTRVAGTKKELTA